MFDDKVAASISKSLKTLATIKLAEELYTKEQREEFYEKLKELEAVSENLRNSLELKAKKHMEIQESEKREEAGRDHRIEILQNQFATKEDMDRLTAAEKNIALFKKEHPILSEIHSLLKR